MFQLETQHSCLDTDIRAQFHLAFCHRLTKMLMLQKRCLLAVLCAAVIVHGKPSTVHSDESAAAAKRVRQGNRRVMKKTKIGAPPPSRNPPTPAPTGGVPPSPPPTTPAIVTPSPTASVTTAACKNILWSDEFINGVVDNSIWNYDEGRGNNGWGNFELQTYSSTNTVVRDGKLVISVSEESTSDGSRTFSSARINTKDKVEILYGTIEARIKLPASLADGLWPAFWTLGGNIREVSWPACGEIDIMEMGSEQSQIENAIHNRVTSAVHWENAGQGASFGQSFVATTPLNDGEFHVFRLEWTSTAITTYVDDNLVLEFNISPDVCTDCAEYRQPHFVILNVAVGGTFPGIVDETGVTAPLPTEMEVDYVRVCDNGETQLSGSAIEERIEFGFDCGLPNTCTTSALNNYAGDARCGSRIQFLIESGLLEEEACREVGFDEFPEHCGVCYEQSVQCDVPDTCTAAALSVDADGFSCGDRINFLIGTGLSEVEACGVIAIVEFPNECGACAPPVASIDCGQPETCTADALAADADGFSCGDRIEFLINSQGQSELAACDQVAKAQFPTKCGACAPQEIPPQVVDCGVPGTCTQSVLKTIAAGFPCGDRIAFLIKNGGLSVADACLEVAVMEFPTECGGCAPQSQVLDCGVPETCTKSVLETLAAGFPCVDRITFLTNKNGLSAVDACTQVAVKEFPTECGGCNPNP
jgi:beta-glucanase (GH16 family)